MELGRYLTSFLRIYINTNLELDNFRNGNLTDYEKRIFIHEYTHFLQNITGGFGHLHAWNVYDRIRQHIVDLRNKNVTAIEIPIIGSVADEQKLFHKIRKRIQGSYKVVAGMEDSSTIIKGIKIVKDEDFEMLYPDRPTVNYLVLNLSDKNNNEMEYIFGEAAISEAMAFLMEAKYFETDPADNFPYHVCRLLGRYMGIELIEKDEYLFSICDVALLTSFPGLLFFKILEDIREKTFEPSKSEELFDYGIDFLYSIGWQVMEDYQKHMEGTCHVIESLLNNRVFKETSEWVVYLFRNGFECRKRNMHLLIQLFKEPKPFEGFWNNIIAQFGNPEIHNNTPKRAFIAPVDLKEIEDKIQPILMLALNEVYQTLFFRKTECALLEFCQHSKNGLKTDERCTTAPWERSTDEFTCAYGALWANFSLAGLPVTINN